MNQGFAGQFPMCLIPVNLVCYSDDFPSIITTISREPEACLFRIFIITSFIQTALLYDTTAVI
jgi:hypothetical protein